MRAVETITWSGHSQGQIQENEKGGASRKAKPRTRVAEPPRAPSCLQKCFSFLHFVHKMTFELSY